MLCEQSIFSALRGAHLDKRRTSNSAGRTDGAPRRRVLRARMPISRDPRPNSSILSIAYVDETSASDSAPRHGSEESSRKLAITRSTQHGMHRGKPDHFDHLGLN